MFMDVLGGSFIMSPQTSINMLLSLITFGDFLASGVVTGLDSFSLDLLSLSVDIVKLGRTLRVPSSDLELLSFDFSFSPLELELEIFSSFPLKEERLSSFCL